MSSLKKSFTGASIESTPTYVIDGLSLELEAGQFYTIFGPNGSGKTTFINILAGIVAADSGSIAIAGWGEGGRESSYMFQNFSESLFPWRTAEGNIMFPLECRYADSTLRRSLLQEFLASFPLPVPLAARVYQLSIGQRQMVCLARALVSRPKLILLDEPFSALDLRMRQSFQDWILEYWKFSGATILLISHEIDEAIYLGGKLLVFPPKPVAAVDEISINLSYPRSRQMLVSEEVSGIRARVLKFLGYYAGYE